MRYKTLDKDSESYIENKIYEFIIARTLTRNGVTPKEIVESYGLSIDYVKTMLTKMKTQGKITETTED